LANHHNPRDWAMPRSTERRWCYAKQVPDA
jgi:hypothetical protein